MARNLANSVLGPYVLRDLIGAGGVAEVFRAHHRDGDGKEYAVKVMRPERAAEKQQVKDFLEEFDTLSHLKHRAIPVARRQGEISGCPAFVMDLIPGRNLAELQAKGVSFPGVQVLAELCDVASYLHKQDIIHNDLKLDNCILRPDNVIAVVDFGSVRYPRRTSLVERLFKRSPTTIFGTAMYLAPELIAGKRPTFRTDVYALGVCAFLLLTGRPPFSETRESGKLRANLTFSPPSIISRLPGIHPAVAEILDRCLAKDPDDRPMSATEVFGAANLYLNKLRESDVHRAKNPGQRQVSPSLQAAVDRVDL